MFLSLYSVRYRYLNIDILCLIKKQKQSELHSDRLAGICTRFPLCGTQEESLFYSVAAATAAFRCTGAEAEYSFRSGLLYHFFDACQVFYSFFVQ